MSYAYDYDAHDQFAADAAVDERVTFIKKVYMHLGMSIVAFIALEAVFLNTPAIYMPLMNIIGSAWWAAMLAFMIVAWVAQSWAHSEVSVGKQYAGLALYTLAEALIFVPILLIANTMSPDIIPQAALLTSIIFCGLTAVVMLTKSDFSFLRNILWMGGLAAMGVIVASWIFSFSLGIVFVAAMIVLMSGYILYDTSNILHNYRTDQYVGASLALFASVATLFWYVIRLVMILSDND